jgi:threonine dehydrogenase-like Zn-dependent dehydrogenase
MNIYEPAVMQAVIYEGPFNISVKEHPKPVILNESDAILKVQIAGICGSDLHMYRGHQKTTTGHIMVHPSQYSLNSLLILNISNMK